MAWSRIDPNGFRIPVDCFRDDEYEEYRQKGWLHMCSNGIERDKHIQIVHPDGHELNYLFSESGSLRFNLDEDGLIDSYEVVNDL